ncbi:hypothetical protein DXG01_012822, partial [Tephrocybe rancida]
FELVVDDDELNHIVQRCCCVRNFELVVDDDELNYLVSTRQGSIDGSLPPLPPLLDVFVGQLPPPSGINDSGSTVPSQSKRPHDDKKPNPFVDLEAEVDAQDERDLDEAGADNEFDDFIDDCEDYGEEDPPTTEDREDDEDLDALLDDDEE